MKKFLALAVAAALAASPVYAGSKSSSNSNSSSSSGSASQAGASAGVNIVTNGSKGHRIASAAVGPGLIAGGLSCSGSASVGGAGSGWGISFGMTKEDRYCNAREDAKYIHGVTGNSRAAMERLCDTREIRDAFARAGVSCGAQPQRASGQSYQKPASYAQAQPVVRRSFKNMRACRAYAAETPGVRCVSR